MPLRGLYAVTPEHPRPDRGLAEQVEQAVLGGARLVQYRDKGRDGSRRRQTRSKAAASSRRRGVPLVINDDPALARAVGADGVHLGRDDADPAAARHLLGAHALIGVSCYGSLERARQAVRQGASYVAFGRFFPSLSKPRAQAAEAELLRRARREIPLPLGAIGGITPQNGQPLIAAGADMLAAIDAVFNRGDIRAASAAFAALFDTERQP
jgi:thiamine-phosphate pyrophosphorylase